MVNAWNFMEFTLGQMVFLSHPQGEHIQCFRKEDLGLALGQDLSIEKSNTQPRLAAKKEITPLVHQRE